MDPADIPESYSLRLNEPLARRWLAHAIAREEGYEPRDRMLSELQAARLAYLEAAIKDTGLKVSDELAMLRELSTLDELRQEPLSPPGRPGSDLLERLQPQIRLRYDARDAEDADHTDELVSYACESGLFGSGVHIDFAFHHHPAGDSGFWWHVQLIVDDVRLTLTSQYYELDVLAAERESGLESAMSVLAEAERAGNETIANLPRFLATLAARKSCSCGEAWADEPGHDDDQTVSPSPAGLRCKDVSNARGAG